MDKYKSYIENLAQNKDGMLFQNASPEHACIVMSTIFKSAEKDIKIFAGNLNGPVSNNQSPELKNIYINSLIKFIEEKRGSLSILLDEFEDVFLNSELYSKLNLYSFLYPNRVSIKKLDASLFINNPEAKFHFTVADGRMFRLEKDVKKFTAFGSFNNKDISKNLSDYFDIYFKSDAAKKVA